MKISQSEAGDRCAAKAPADRLSFLASLCPIRMQISVPKPVLRGGRQAGAGQGATGSRHAPAASEADAVTCCPSGSVPAWSRS